MNAYLRPVAQDFIEQLHRRVLLGRAIGGKVVTKIASAVQSKNNKVYFRRSRPRLAYIACKFPELLQQIAAMIEADNPRRSFRHCLQQAGPFHFRRGKVGEDEAGLLALAVQAEYAAADQAHGSGLIAHYYKQVRAGLPAE